MIKTIMTEVDTMTTGRHDKKVNNFTKGLDGFNIISNSSHSIKKPEGTTATVLVTVIEYKEE